MVSLMRLARGRNTTSATTPLRRSWVETFEAAPADATRWSTRGLAAKIGVSHTLERFGGRSG